MGHFKYSQGYMKNSVINSVVISLSLLDWAIKGSNNILVFKQSLQRQSAISFSGANVMKNGRSGITTGFPKLGGWGTVCVAVVGGPPH